MKCKFNDFIQNLFAMKYYGNVDKFEIKKIKKTFKKTKPSN